MARFALRTSVALTFGLLSLLATPQFVLAQIGGGGGNTVGGGRYGRRRGRCRWRSAPRHER